MRANWGDTHASGSPDPIELLEAANYELSQSSLPAGMAPLLTISPRRPLISQRWQIWMPPPASGLCVETLINRLEVNLQQVSVGEPGS